MNSAAEKCSSYRGRFAPSPSGPLHFGSLLAALGSYLDARAHGGVWLVRIEDIDPPREMPGADALILRQLETFGLHSDDEILYQSTRLPAYEAKLDQLRHEGAAYHCACTRKRIKSIGGHYDNHCRPLDLPAEGSAVRFAHQRPIPSFADLRLGQVELKPPWDQEDFIVQRRDGLVAYQLAVVMDDIEQGITHVVRGSDLLETTGWQLALYRHWNHPPPAYLHLPLALDANGHKLSKQNHAPALNTNEPQAELFRALTGLNLKPPAALDRAPVPELLAWAVTRWRRAALGREKELAWQGT